LIFVRLFPEWCPGKSLLSEFRLLDEYIGEVKMKKWFYAEFRIPYEIYRTLPVRLVEPDFKPGRQYRIPGGMGGVLSGAGDFLLSQGDFQKT